MYTKLIIITSLKFMHLETQLALLFLLVVPFTQAKIIVESTYPHNKNCYTQGLFFLNDTHIFETCGLYDQSYFHVLEYQATPFELREVYSSKIPWRSNIFFEGAILFKGRIYILTWREKVVYQIDPATFSLIKEIAWNKDGWGLTTNGTHMFTTDGSDQIYIVDDKFNILAQKSIRSLSGGSQRSINELEFVGGFIYANIYTETKIVKIDVEKSQVVEQFDASSIAQSERSLGSTEVINGIAYDRTNAKFILTGKQWSKVYQTTFVNSQNRFEPVLFVVLMLCAILL